MIDLHMLNQGCCAKSPERCRDILAAMLTRAAFGLFDAIDSNSTGGCYVPINEMGSDGHPHCLKTIPEKSPPAAPVPDKEAPLSQKTSPSRPIRQSRAKKHDSPH